MTAATVARLRDRLTEVFQPLQLDIEDDSHRHAGHAGARSGGHFNVTIVSAAFAGQSTVSRHRLVYQAVNDLMEGQVHALSIRAHAPGEV